MTQPRNIGAAPARSDRIVDVQLDSHSLVTRTADIEIERHKAISDLLADNTFAPINTEGGPWRLRLSLDGDRLAIEAQCTRSKAAESFRLPLQPFRGHLGDYAILCDNFYKTARTGQIHKLETIDAGRRSIHDEAAELLLEKLSAAARLDRLTARRLFSLLYVLHMRTTPTLL